MRGREGGIEGGRQGGRDGGGGGREGFVYLVSECSIPRLQISSATTAQSIHKTMFH